MNQLGIFAKYWQPGSVKTRLAKSIGPQWASVVYRGFLSVLLSRMHGQADCHVLAYWPPERQADFDRISCSRWTLTPQQPGDLGDRMRHYFREALAGGASKVVLLGSDSPTLPTDYIDRVWQALDQHPVALGPTADGGYYVLGIRDDLPEIFADIAWSSPSVWSQTVDRLRRAHIPYAQLPPWYDVDDLDDLIRLEAELARLATGDAIWNQLLSVVGSALRERPPRRRLGR